MDALHRLREAITQGNLAITKRLLARFPELWLNTDPAHSGWCNLHYASFHGNYLVCFHLISMMGQKRLLLCVLDLVTFDDLTVLHLPIFRQHLQTLHLLLQEFSAPHWINYRGGSEGRTPLHYCCVHHFVDGLKLLLEFGADWTLPDNNGDTCLHLCFAYNSLACMEQLIRFVATKPAALEEEREYNENDKHHNSENTSENAWGKESEGKKDKNACETDPRDPLAVLAQLEKTRNNRDYVPAYLAASFELQNNYQSLKSAWVEKALSTLLQLYPLPSPLRTVSESLVTNIVSERVSESSRVSDSSSDKADTLAEETDMLSSKTYITTHEAYGRKHLALLPPAPNDDRPQLLRRHSKSLASKSAGPIFSSKSSALLPGSSPLQVRAPSTPQNHSNPKSPLQVEFTRTQSRKSLSTPQTRQHKEGQDEPSKSPFPSIATPGLLKSVHQFFFSPILDRQRSVSSSSDVRERELSNFASRNSSGNSTPVSRVPLSRTSLKFSQNGSLRRNSSTPSVMLLGGEKRPAKTPVPQKKSISSSALTEIDTLPSADRSMELLSEDKALGFLVKTPKSKEERKEKRSGNVSSISFTSIRDEF